MSIIVYELNEVPKKLFDFYSNSHPNSAFSFLRKHSSLYETHTADVGSLSPWITWPTMHRGVSNVDHEISDLGQDLRKINVEFPNVQHILADHGVRVGIFGSLQSYPLPKNLDNFAFYIPDTFAAGDECFPKELSDFQAFNLSMVRNNGRNVSKGIAVKDAARFLIKSKQLGLTTKTFLKLTNQLLTEQLNSDRVVRRRTSQTQIAFDLYFRQLTKTNPDISFFFTNHVASSMHRYWPTVFPEDYEEGKFDKLWRDRWAQEIPFTIKVANYQLKKLIQYCWETRSELVVCSSMGQGAVLGAKPIRNQVLIVNINNLLSYLDVKRSDWEPRLSMAPRVVIMPKSAAVIKKIDRLKDIFINGKNIKYIITSSGDIRFEIELTNQENISVIDRDVQIDMRRMGLDNVNLQDASGSYAYHIPEGILLHFNAKNKRIRVPQDRWTAVNALDFAPSILNKFSKKIPSYMQKENLFL